MIYKRLGVCRSTCYKEVTTFFFFFLNTHAVLILILFKYIHKRWLYCILFISFVCNMISIFFTKYIDKPNANSNNELILLICACKPTSLQWAICLTIFKKICSYFQEWFSLHYIVYVHFACYKENNISVKVLDQVWHIILHRLIDREIRAFYALLSLSLTHRNTHKSTQSFYQLLTMRWFKQECKYSPGKRDHCKIIHLQDKSKLSLKIS